MRYSPALDGLRGVSVMLVLGLHASYGHFRGGWLGVNVFFVLSGFLITAILIEEWHRRGSISLKRFYYRRALRLLPALLATLLLTGVLWWLLAWPQSFTYGALASLFYYSNWVRAFDGPDLGAFGHMWSLSVEEQFYLVWPLALMPLLRRYTGRHSLASVLGALVLFLAGLRALLWYQGSALADYNSTLARADGLVLGAVIAVLFRSQRFVSIAATGWVQLLAWVGLAATLSAAAVVSPRAPWLYSHAGLLFFSLAAGAMIVNVVADEKGAFARLLSTAPSVWIGKRSYGIYLYHFAVFQAFEEVRLPNSIANFALVSVLRFATCILVSAASYAWLEQRFLLLKDSLATSGYAPSRPA